MPPIDPREVAKRYNALDIIIDADDKWHLKTKSEISKFIHAVLQRIPNYSNLKILNAGSAGYSYGLSEENILHVDVADKHLVGRANSLVADIANLPLPNDQFDGIICVGSVLNYCDPIVVLKEFQRVLKKGGFLILEFECSKTFELTFKKGYNRSAVFIETVFDAHGDKESIWYFSEENIVRIMSSFNFSLQKLKRFHILSPLILRITGKPSFSSTFSALDPLCKFIPGIRKHCSNVICLFRLDS